MVKPEITNYNAGLRQPVHLILRNRPRNLSVEQVEKAIEIISEAEMAGVPLDLRRRVWRMWEMAAQLEIPRQFKLYGDWLHEYVTPW
jgi:hypothetical protein